MLKCTKAQIEKHLKTHSERSVDDTDAVTVLQNFLKSEGKINPDFNKNDKWPNIDGRFELVSNPSVSRRPNQNFFVQIKGTTSYNIDEDGCFQYRLKDLAFPAFVYTEVTLDPCILFVVLDPSKRGKEHIFWKYMSIDCLSSIDFKKDSASIKFTRDDEVLNSDEAINAFAEKLTKLSDSHSFVKRLELIDYPKSTILSLIDVCNCQICEAIDRIDLINDSRDNVSKRMLTRLEDLCSATLLLNCMGKGYENPDIRLSWELSLMDVRTNFLGGFLQSLRYIGRRIPEDGQSERLMLKYYSFLWEIRKYLNDFHKIKVLSNLESFPHDLDEDDKEYYQLVADTVEKVVNQTSGWRKSRYYVQKCTPFFVGTERYFEITLQLAGIYATKFHRLTVYTKKKISTNYSIQIDYAETNLKLWNSDSKIKVVTNWKVSIEPTVLNKLSAIFGVELKLSSTFKEYTFLMDFLTRSGINLLDLIDLRQNQFDQVISKIYGAATTTYFREILVMLKQRFSADMKFIRGRNVIRYLLLKLREEVLESVKRGESDKEFPNRDLLLTSRSIPFDNNPLLYNLPNRKTNNKSFSNDIVRVVGHKTAATHLPYIFLKQLIESTGEIFTERSNLDNVFGEQNVIEYNSHLSLWDKEQGNSLEEENGFVYIESYERNTLAILRKLIAFSQKGNDGQKQLNKKFVKENSDSFSDDAKKKIVENAFVDSKLLMIYGAAGTGKTTLINYLSNLMQGRSKLFLANTHTAVENLKRRIDAPGQASSFVNIDKFLRSGNSKNSNYDIVFVDESSTVDNRKMLELLKRISINSLLVLAGDIYQIESIDFGNWFFYAKDILPSTAVVELNSTWRTEDESLKRLWDEVRCKGNLITEKLVIDGPFSKTISGKLFINNEENDEIVLCLNYDGRFGLNNINNYFQEANSSNPTYHWHEWNYKVGDPILFNDTKRFPALYNNLKGRIIAIWANESSITFDVDVGIILTSLDIYNSDLEILGRTANSTQVRFTICEGRGGANEEDREKARMETIVPFQLAYAVSIHKSQGLEYDSVKIVIPNNISEKISHGIFYTAITRAKKKLKIFWSSETMTKVISDFEKFDKKNKSLEIVKGKLNQKSDYS